LVIAIVRIARPMTMPAFFLSLALTRNTVIAARIGIYQFCLSVMYGKKASNSGLERVLLNSRKRERSILTMNSLTVFNPMAFSNHGDLNMRIRWDGRQIKGENTWNHSPRWFSLVVIPLINPIMAVSGLSNRK